MTPVAIITIIVAISVVGGVFGTWLYRKLKHKPTGECACCHSSGKNLVKAYRKKYPHKKR